MVPREYSKWGKIYCRKSKITKKSKSVSRLNSDLLPLPPARMMEAPLAGGGAGGRHTWPRSQGLSPRTPSPGIWFDLEEEAAGISQPAAHPQHHSPEVFRTLIPARPTLLAGGRSSTQGGRGAARSPGASIPTQGLTGHRGEGGRCPHPSFGVTPRSSWRQSALQNREFPALLQGVALFGPGFRTGVPGGSDGKESACSAGDPGSAPGLGRSPGEGNGYPLPYSCGRNPRKEEPNRTE